MNIGGVPEYRFAPPRRWRFCVHGNPEPQARPRVSFHSGYAHAYSPKSEWYETFFTAAKIYAPERIISSPVFLSVEFRFKKLRSTKKSDLWKSVRPDLDNLLKAIFDAMTQAKWWKDDGLIVSVRSKKIFTNGEPGVTVYAKEII